MRVRVTVIVVLGLLLQALAVVRHNTTMVGDGLRDGAGIVAAAGLPDLARDLIASICHPGGEGGGAALPDGAPGQSGAGCPICNGLVSAYGLAAPQIITPAMRVVAVAIEFTVLDERVRTHAFIRPHSRGPPALV
ncbi:MAG: hypothetical protein NW223_14065 [Hyphomicrobiaceae bacterium]|nr:hypothetical protein [Hyphomicrobiaceae bacterium]